MEISKEELSDVIKDAVKTGVQAAEAEREAAKRPTKGEIMSIKDPIKRQQAIRDNLDLF